jgi:hypothetical protein
MILLLTACMPLISGPTPVPLPVGRRGEVGGALYGGSTPLIEREDALRREVGPTVGGTVFGRFELKNGMGFGGRVDVGPAQLGAAGVWLKVGLIRRHTSFLGIQFDAGFAWGELSFPAAFRVGDEVWVWTRPGARVAALPAGVLPFGVTWEVTPGSAVSLELSTLAPMAFDGADSNQAVGLVGALAMSARF